MPSASNDLIPPAVANICGSDLHPYEGRAPLDGGMVLGHENMGVVEQAGAGVDKEPDRLALAAKYGATPVNFAEADPADVIRPARQQS
jgi:threonine dehydrogenase-like Zn-dependent dehydrogenase